MLTAKLCSDCSGAASRSACASLQPPYFVNQMIARSYQPNGLNCSVSSETDAGAPAVDCFAAASDSGDTIVLRCVNDQAEGVTAAVALAGGAAARSWSMDISTMQGRCPNLNNTPAFPRLVAPVQQPRRILTETGKANLDLPAFSFTVATMTYKVR